MPTEVKTKRVRRSWTDRLQLWPRAYQTKISDERHEAFGRGPRPESIPQRGYAALDRSAAF